MVSSIGPFWDANETWLVLGVGILLVAFPAAHGVVLGALYLPVAAMLVGLMLRGVAFEFRVKAEGWHRELWNWLFWVGSFLASLRAGPDARALHHRLRAGLRLLAVRAGLGAALCGGYVLLGATWLIYRTEGALQREGARLGALGPAVGRARRRAGEPRHAARERDGAGEVVRFPADALPDASADREPLARGSGCGSHLKKSDTEAIRRRGGDLRARLRRARLQPVSLRRHRPHDDLGGGGAPERAEVRAHRRRRRAALHRRLHVLVYRMFRGKTKDGAY